MSVSEGIGRTAFAEVNRDDPILVGADVTDPFVFATVTEQVMVEFYLHTSGCTGQLSASSGLIANLNFTILAERSMYSHCFLGFTPLLLTNTPHIP